jgi:hypothetical protein
MDPSTQAPPEPFLLVLSAGSIGYRKWFCALSTLQTTDLDGLPQYLNASIKFGQGHKLACLVGNTDITRTENHGVSTEFDHLSGFGAERNCPCFLPREPFQKLNKLRVGGDVETRIGTAGNYLAIEVSV